MKHDVTSLLSAIEQGDPQGAKQLLPLVYDELRKLAARRLAEEKPGQTLQATNTGARWGCERWPSCLAGGVGADSLLLTVRAVGQASAEQKRFRYDKSKAR